MMSGDNAKAVVLLDGGMGQELLRRSHRPPHPLWSARVMAEEPQLVCNIHQDFIDAGARVITLNTYSATPERLAEHGMADSFEALQLAAIRAARQAVENAAEQRVDIAGCLPPLVASYRPELSPPWDETLDTYRQIVAVQAPHVDLFLCETMSSQFEARAAATAAGESGKPLWVAMSVSDDQPGALRSGEPLSEACSALLALGVNALLLNCSRPESIHACWSTFSRCPTLTGAYANGFTSVGALEPGGTVAVLESRQDLDPDAYADHAMQWVESGAGIVGGCCEISPAHIAVLNTRLLDAGFSVTAAPD